MKRSDMFQNLVLMAAADGKLTDEEVNMLGNRAARWGLTDEEVDKAIRNANNPDWQLAVPATDIERIEMLREMIRMMAADGEMSHAEKRLCAVAAAVMEISPEQFEQILDTM